MQNTSIQPLPAKYNGDLLYQINHFAKKSFTIDYLNINLLGSFRPLESDRRKFHDLGHSTKIFRKVHTVFVDDYKIGTFVSVPASSALNPLLVQFKVENYLFYVMPPATLKKILNDLFKSLRLSFSSVNRLDLALDIEDENSTTQTLLKKLVNDELRVSGRSKAVNPYYVTKNGFLSLQGCAIGSRSSSRYLRIYDKTKEMEQNPKQYIDAYHKRNGLNKNIWRFEYQLNGKFLRDKKNINLDSLFDFNFIYSLYVDSYSNHFSFKYNTYKKECNHEENYPFLSFDMIRKQLSLLTVEIIKLKRKINETLIGQKRIVKSLCRSYFSTSQPSYAKPIQFILDSYSLNDWFDSKFPSYLNEFMKKAMNNKFNTHEFFKILENESKVSNC
jgi:hypothetical protein